MIRNSSLVLFALLGIFLSACSTSDKVSTGNIIQKRKYTKGFFIDPPKNITAKNSGAGKIEINTDVEPTIESAVVEAFEEPIETASVTEQPIVINSASEGQKFKSPGSFPLISFEQIQHEILKTRSAAKNAKTSEKLNIKRDLNLWAIIGFSLAVIGSLLFLITNIHPIIIAIGILFTILAIIFSTIALLKGNLKGLAIAGLVIASLQLLILAVTILYIILIYIFLFLFL
jgi:hypothetical protein